MCYRILTLTILLGLTLVPGASAQQVAGEPSVPLQSGQLEDYQLGPGDQISIRVQGVREFSQVGRISNSGRIRVPYVGIMFAAGKTLHELEIEIATRIKEHELVNEPLVRVEIDQQRATPAYIVGEVDTPGQFVITGDMYLLDLISRAGGLLPSAGSHAYIYRRPKARPEVTARIAVDPAEVAEPSPRPAEASPAPADGDGDGEVIEINLDDLQDGARPELNAKISGGDIVHIARRPMRNIYIIGDVKVPGVYMMPRRGEVTAMQAVAYAGGPMVTAKARSGFLMRYNEAGQHEAIPVNFWDILNGKAPDVPVKPDDIIFIPNSAVKTIGVGLLNLIPNLIIQILIF